MDATILSPMFLALMGNTNEFKYIAFAGFVLAGIFAVVSVVLFFRLQIRDVSKDLSGKQAQEQIMAMRNRSFADVNKKAAANVFQGLEQGSKRLRETASSPISRAKTEGTTVLQQQKPFSQFPGYQGEKKLIYISTKEII